MKTLIKVRSKSAVVDDGIDEIATIECHGHMDTELLLDRDAFGGVYVESAKQFQRPDLENELDGIAAALEGFRHQVAKVQVSIDETQQRLIGLKRLMGWEG